MLDWLARVVTTRRALVLVTLVLTTAGLGTQIPKIRVDPSVENLISSFEGESRAAEAEARFEHDFGDTDRVMLLVLTADDVLAKGPLGHLDALTQHFEAQDWIESVFSLTRTPLPRRVTPPEEAGGLDALEDELGGEGGLDDLEAELAGEEEDSADHDLQAEVVDTLVRLVEADPARFPGGFQALGPKLSRELRTTPIVEGDEVTDESLAELRVALEQSSLIEGRLISADHQLAVTAMSIKRLGSREMRERVVELREYLEAHPPPAGVEVHLGGLPYLRTSIVESIRSDQLMLVPLTLVVSMLLLALTLRWLPGVLLPIAAVGLTAIIVVGGMALLGEPFNVLSNIIPTLLIIIGISDSIHLIGRYREELIRGGDTSDDPRTEAAQKTVRGMAVACLLTSLTTAVGLGSLVVSKTVMLRHFGVTSAIGVMIAYVVTIAFLPAVITWVRRPSKVAQAAGGWLEVGIMRMTAWVLGRPWQILAVTTVILGVAMWVATRLNVDHALLDQFDEEDETYVVTRLLEEELDGVQPLEVSLTSTTEGRFYDASLLRRIDEVADWATERDEVLSSMSQNDVLRQTLYLLSLDPSARSGAFVNDEEVKALSALLEVRSEQANPLASWVTPDRTHFRLQLKVRDVGAQATVRFIDELEDKLRAALDGTGVDYAFTGEAYKGSKGMEAVVGDLLSSLLTAVVIIFVLLVMLFRSLRLGLLSIPPNIIPLVFSMAYMVLRGIPLNAATGIIFSISLGLAVDGSIHVLARFREETLENKFRPHPALIRAARGTGRAIVISCVTLMAGFAVLLVSNFVPVRRFGELIGVSVGACLFATLIVQPALLQVAGVSRRVRAEHARNRDESAAAAAE